MTDHHDPDELASSHLDGATSPDAAALVAADPALQERVEAMRAVRAAIQHPVDVDAAARDAAIAAALDAFDEEVAAPAAPAGGTVTPIAPRRSLSPTARRVLGAAAVVALLALLVPLLANSGQDDAESADATFEETGDAIGGRGEAEASAGDGGAEMGGADAATSTSLRGQVLALGTFDDVDELLDLLEARSPDFSRTADDVTAPEAQLSYPPCPTDEPVLGVADVAGDEVVVTLAEADGLFAVVTDARTCEVLEARRL